MFVFSYKLESCFWLFAGCDVYQCNPFIWVCILTDCHGKPVNWTQWTKHFNMAALDILKYLVSSFFFFFKYPNPFLIDGGCQSLGYISNIINLCDDWWRTSQHIVFSNRGIILLTDFGKLFINRHTTTHVCICVCV